jgi:hypothetical protein
MWTLPFRRALPGAAEYPVAPEVTVRGERLAAWQSREVVGTSLG